VMRTELKQILSVPFDLAKGRLIVDVNLGPDQPVPHPLTSVKRLYLVRGNQRREIHTLNDLCREVRLLSQRDAVSYLRLSTAAPFTWYLFQFQSPNVSRIDVIDRSTITSDFTYSEPGMDAVEKTFRNGVCGILDHKLYISLNIPPISVMNYGDAFVVERPLYVEQRRESRVVSRQIQVLRQRVSKVGCVDDLKTYLLPDRIAHAIDWLILKV